MNIFKTDEMETSFLSSPEDSGAAVAIVICTIPTAAVLLLRRSRQESDPWSGHFAFPGGRKDRRDRDLLATCLRETVEETAIVLDKSSLVRELNPTMAGSRVKSPVLVQPYLFKLVERPAVTIQESEIESYLWLDIKHFLDLRNHCVAEVLPGRFFPAFALDDYYLWGFTYGVLCSVFQLDIDRSERFP